ncbi:hypothetical protein KBY28_16655 [Ruegeria pomeroyi]|uniref:hypothetical protein n=1 Tax=Ruegeria pomeroyi TaxID=89184 RepID=UPI001F43E0AC|nr:hypothetical protein [Ruegeria pomeroyi]MCE8510084.1 hypothetical protein [Ruegeria pomeroyi]
MDINQKRDAALTVEVKDESDPSGCISMIGIGEAMHIVKENSIWKFELADKADPERTNINVPNALQKVASIGANSRIVRQTLLQSTYFLKNALCGKPLETPVLEQALRACLELSKLCKISEELEADLVRAFAIVNEGTSRGTLRLPHYPDLTSTWTSALGAMDGVRASIREMAFAFFPDISKNNIWFNDLRECFTFKAFETSDNDGILDAVDESLGFVRWLRNAKEHPKVGQRLEILDYRLRPDARVAPPSIRLERKEGNWEEYDLAAAIEQLRRSLLYAFEMVLVFSIGEFVGEVMGQQAKIGWIPDENRRSIDQPDYCILVDIHGRLQRLG